MTRNLRTRKQENKGTSERIQENIGTRGQDNKVNVIRSGGAKLGDKRITYRNNTKWVAIAPPLDVFSENT